MTVCIGRRATLPIVDNYVPLPGLSTTTGGAGRDDHDKLDPALNVGGNPIEEEGEAGHDASTRGANGPEVVVVGSASPSVVQLLQIDGEAARLVFLPIRRT